MTMTLAISSVVHTFQDGIQVFHNQSQIIVLLMKLSKHENNYRLNKEDNGDPIILKFKVKTANSCLGLNIHRYHVVFS